MRQLFHFMAVSAAILTLLSCTSQQKIINETFPDVSESSHKGWFPLASESQASVIFLDDEDHAVVKTAAGLLTDDVERITGKHAEIITAERLSEIEATPAVVAGTIGHSRLIDEMAECGIIDISSIKGKWESYIV